MKKYLNHMTAIAAVGIVSAALAASASADVTSLQKVEITKGNLVVLGKTSGPGQKVVLDKIFETKSNAKSVFVFKLAYLPADCTVDLKVGRSTMNAIVAGCGPKGLNPLGEWNARTRYVADDLVTFLGSSWRSKTNNVITKPPSSPETWELFASKGDPGIMGPKGDIGDPGPKGDAGDPGPKGDAGDPGPKGDTGAIGATGPQGPAGPSGPQGETGPSGVTAALSFGGATATIPAGDVNTYYFAGPTAQVVLTGSKKLTGSAAVNMWFSGTPPTTATRFLIRMCAAQVGQQPSAFGQHLYVQLPPNSGFSGQWLPVATAGQLSLPSGTWDVGVCLRYFVGTLPLNGGLDGAQTTGMYIVTD